MNKPSSASLEPCHELQPSNLDGSQLDLLQVCQCLVLYSWAQNRVCYSGCSLEVMNTRKILLPWTCWQCFCYAAWYRIGLYKLQGAHSWLIFIVFTISPRFLFLRCRTDELKLSIRISIQPIKIKLIQSPLLPCFELPHSCLPPTFSLVSSANLIVLYPATQAGKIESSSLQYQPLKYLLHLQLATS